MTGQGDPQAVAAANEAFYRAFERLDVEAMDACWAKGVPVSCVHPGWDALVGREAVMTSWRDIFDATEQMTFRIESPRVLMLGDTAWVLCRETLVSVVRGQSVRASLIATNAFIKHDGVWRIVHHHASPLVEERAERADETGPRTLH